MASKSMGVVEAVRHRRAAMAEHIHVEAVGVQVSDERPIARKIGTGIQSEVGSQDDRFTGTVPGAGARQRGKLHPSSVYVQPDQAL